jgi:hypothetical protein
MILMRIWKEEEIIDKIQEISLYFIDLLKERLVFRKNKIMKEKRECVRVRQRKRGKID